MSLSPSFWPVVALLRGTDELPPQAEADAALYRFQTEQPREMIVRLVGTGVPALAIWAVYDAMVPLLAFVVYCGTLSVLHRAAARLRVRWSDVTYRMVMVFHALAAALFSGTTLWLLAQPQEVLRMVAAALLVGNLIYGLAGMVRGPQLHRIDTLVTTLTVIGFGMVLLDPDRPLAENALIGIVTVALAAYHHVAAAEKLRDRGRMQGVTKAGLHAQGQAAVGRLAGGFAHDFNNLLTALLGNLELYDTARTKADEKAAIAAARQAAERGAQLVAQLLSVSGRAVMRPGTLDLPDFFSDLRQVTHRLFGPDISVQYETHPGLPQVLVDRTQLTGALIQVLLNARDAMPDGGLILIEAAPARHGPETHGLRPAAPPHGYVQITVYDEGVGIAPADLPRVTEPFFTTRKFGEATGLGLAVTKGFAEQSGGSLSIHSKPGRGTRVTLLLPAAPDTAPEPKPAPAPETTLAPATASPSKG